MKRLNRQAEPPIRQVLAGASARPAAAIVFELPGVELKAEINIVIARDLAGAERDLNGDLVAIQEPVLVLPEPHPDGKRLLAGGLGMKPRYGNEKFEACLARGLE